MTIGQWTIFPHTKALSFTIGIIVDNQIWDLIFMRNFTAQAISTQALIRERKWNTKTRMNLISSAKKQRRF